MLIPSIDLQGGKIVQLVQGERLAVETTTSRRGSTIRRLSQGAADRSGRRQGRRATTRRWSRRSAPRCRAASAAASASIERARSGAGARRDEGDPRLGALRGRRRGRRVRQRAGRRGRSRAAHRRRRRRGGRVVIHGWRTALDLDRRSRPSRCSSRSSASSSTPTSTSRG